jgi:hypothetical protein
MSNVLVLPAPEPDLETKIATCIDSARALRIDTDAAMDAAGSLLLQIKTRRDELDEAYDSIIKKAHDAHKEALGKKATYEKPLIEAELTIKKALGDYRREQERKALAERARLEEESRKMAELQQEQEFDAAAAAGDEVAAAQVLEQQIFTPAPVVPIAKPQGISYRETWKFEVTSLAALVKHCAAHPEDLHLLAPNTTAIGQLVKARKSGCNLPGVRVWPDKTVAASSR